MKIIVLNSGGIDSTTCLGMMLEKYNKEDISTITIYYGQTLKKEIECARKIAEYYGVKHYEFDIENIFKYSNCTLLDHSNKKIEESSYEEQYDGNKNISSYVPFRNGVILTVATAIAQSLYENEEVKIILGNHKDDFSYSDCSIDFTNKMNEAIKAGTNNLVSFEAPVVKLTKEDIVKKGLELEVPYELTWSCYKGKDKACGKCASCICRLDAFKKNNTKDVISYGGDNNE